MKGWMLMANIKRTPSGDPVITRIEELLKSQKRTKKELTDYIGINNTNFSKWKYENSKSYMKYLGEIAEFLGVSANYLLEGSPENSINVSDESEMKLIQIYRKLDSHKKELLIDLAEIMST